MIKRRANRSALPLLPWEAASPADQLDALSAEYAPVGPTETALVEQLAWLMARKSRLRAAEAEAHRSGLESYATQERVKALARAAGMVSRDDRDQYAGQTVEIALSDPADDSVDLAECGRDLGATKAALAILDKGGKDAYDRALAALHEDKRDWWVGDHPEDVVNQSPEEKANILAEFLRADVAIFDRSYVAEVSARPQVREAVRARGFDLRPMGELLDIDAKLDRQLEKTLAMLFKLQEVRLAKAQPDTSA